MREGPRSCGARIGAQRRHRPRPALGAAARRKGRPARPGLPSPQPRASPLPAQALPRPTHSSPAAHSQPPSSPRPPLPRPRKLANAISTHLSPRQLSSPLGPARPAWPSPRPSAPTPRPSRPKLLERLLTPSASFQSFTPGLSASQLPGPPSALGPQLGPARPAWPSPRPSLSSLQLPRLGPGQPWPGLPSEQGEDPQALPEAPGQVDLEQ